MDYLDLHRKLDDAVKITADLVAPLVTTLLQPQSILDVGCGNGVWLGAFHRTGVTDILGLDGDYIDRSALQMPPECFHAADLSQAFKLDRIFDLAVSLEVGEHLPESHAEAFVDSITAHAPAVLFSAAIPGQGGVGHINEQWPSYWMAKFARHGFVAYDAVRPKVWHNPDVVYWYAQNVILYVRDTAVSRYPALSETPKVVLSDVIHPRRYVALDRAARLGDDPPLSHLMRNLPRAAGRFVKEKLGQPEHTREPVKEPEPQ
ncbi:hypothetical protein BH11PLA2_BH11PLA2_30680 [soil metagenome]